jgi:hypothetical protein
MKGKIDNNGWLRIERCGKERLQECPYTQKTFQVNNLTIREPCGDWCPLFGEPTQYYSDGVVVANGKTLLTLCHKTLIFDEFTDERVGGNDQKEDV